MTLTINYKIGSIVFAILHIRKLRLKRDNNFAKDHKPSTWKIWDLKFRSMTPEPILLKIVHVFSY